VALFRARPTIPKDSFLEIIFHFPDNPTVIERQFHLDDHIPHVANFSSLLKVKSPWMNNKQIREGEKTEIVINIYEDSGRNRQLGEHHQCVTYIDPPPNPEHL